MATIHCIMRWKLAQQTLLPYSDFSHPCCPVDHPWWSLLVLLLLLAVILSLFQYMIHSRTPTLSVSTYSISYLWCHHYSLVLYFKIHVLSFCSPPTLSLFYPIISLKGFCLQHIPYSIMENTILSISYISTMLLFYHVILQWWHWCPQVALLSTYSISLYGNLVFQ